MAERWFGPAEMARRLGVSPKALRVYERAGLVAPLRTGAGWRAYGPGQAARLHQILALKALGLSIRRVGELLGGDLGSLDCVLDLQQRVLEARRVEAGKALALLAAARRTLKACGALSLDDLTNLTKETVMSETLKIGGGEMGAAFKPLIDKHYTREDLDQLAQRSAEVKAAGYDQPAIAAEWDALFKEAGALFEAEDFTSARAQELARRWMRMAHLFTRGDPELSEKAQAVWTEAMADPDLAPRLPVVPDLFRFVKRIMEGMIARGEWDGPAPPARGG